MLTIGPHESDDAKTICTGEAAHIEAAAEKGLRYNTDLSPAERIAASNGIWLCSRHHTIIDRDERTYTVEQLRGWKADAEKKAFSELSSGPEQQIRSIEETLDELDQRILSHLGVPNPDSVSETLDKIHQCAQNDILNFRNTEEWPTHLVDLNLSVRESDERLTLKVSDISNGFHVSKDIWGTIRLTYHA